MEEKGNNAEDEAMNKLVKEILKGCNWYEKVIVIIFRKIFIKVSIKVSQKIKFELVY